MVDWRVADWVRMFDSVAERYDRARPGYPPQVFDAIAELADVRPVSRVLEIGCGTEQATPPLAKIDRGGAQI